MQAYLETIAIPAHASYVFKKIRSQQLYFHWHYHAEYELTLVQRGAGRRHAGGHVAPYGPGDLVLYGSLLPHTYASLSPPPQRSLVIQFSAATFQGLRGLLPEFGALEALLARSAQGLFFSGPAAKEAARRMRAMGRKQGLEGLLLLFELLRGLAEDGGRELSSLGFSAPPRTIEKPGIERAVNHLYSHITQNLSLSQAAQLASMSVPTFGRAFKRATGKSWVAFVAEFRIGLACKLLIESSKSVSEICYETGFNNLSNFNRRFLSLKGTNPLAFKAQFSIKKNR